MEEAEKKKFIMTVYVTGPDREEVEQAMFEIMNAGDFMLSCAFPEVEVDNYVIDDQE